MRRDVVLVECSILSCEPKGPALWHRITRVHCEIDHEVLQLRRISHHKIQIVGE